MRFSLFVAVALLACASARAEAPLSQRGKCPEDTSVIVEIRGVQLLVPRQSEYHVLLDDGKTHLNLGRPAATYTCDTEVLKNVRGLATTKYKLGYFSGKNTSEKVFALRRAAVLGARKMRESTTVKLPNGVEKTTAPKIAQELFALPQDVAPTYDKVPVIYACDNSETAELAAITPRACTVEYLHPSGLPVAYSVLRSDYPTDDFIAAEKVMRKPIDDMIAAAKAKKDLENKDK